MSILARFRKTAANQNKVTSLKQSPYPMLGIFLCQIRTKRNCAIFQIFSTLTDRHSSFIVLWDQLVCSSNEIKPCRTDPQSVTDNCCDVILTLIEISYGLRVQEFAGHIYIYVNTIPSISLPSANI